MGGTQDGFRTALQEDHPIVNPQEVEEAIAYANEALDAAQSLEETANGIDPFDPTAIDLQKLEVAVENYIDRFNIPTAALESADEEEEEDKVKHSRLKKVILYLYALVERIFKTLFDFFANQKITARKLILPIKNYIGRADSLSSSIAAQLNIKDRSIMVALNIDGIAPQKTPELFDRLADTFEQQYRFSAVAEVVRLVGAARAKEYDRVKKEADILRDKLEAGIKESLNPIDPNTLSVFTEKKNDSLDFYASEALFGQNYITGVIGKEVRENGTFTYHCNIRRDSEVPLRVAFFPVLTPDEIRRVCRTALKVCENVVRFSRDEELMRKILREAAFVKSKDPDQSSVVALRNITAIGQNSYIVHLRFIMRTMQALLRWCSQSIERYENVGK
ncbi:hypothetical protein [Ralstonia phage RP31]|uniref:Uncharacterized protein n=1 Tax=Ralstonia phage RP31 TaxID=1923890 RepID=A0A1L7N203_9CAUD|nr:hypothetical protein [Ralstonia phage RP31]